MNLLAAESTEQFLSGGGEMGKLIRSMDWSKTPLGPISEWPQSLRTSVSLCLSSTFPILIAWGPETIQIYNDSYRPICGAMHPQSMGMNFRICWESALEVVGDKFSRGEQGEGTYIQDQQMFLQRYGYLEEAYMTFSFAPIRDESGGVGGIFHPITETTEKMLSARRTRVLRDLAIGIGKGKSITEIARETESRYADFLNDLPFLLFYEYDQAAQQLNLLTASGVEDAPQLSAPQIDLGTSSGPDWPFAEVLESGTALVVADLPQRFGTYSCAPYPKAPHTAVMLPVFISGQTVPFGFLIAGVSARRALDESYLGFYDLLANTYNTAVSNVFAYEQEQKRAEALAKIDRSKTAFFSNVSHEFRTPLTLMLGPLEDLLSRGNLSEDIKIPVEATHRNALRLLKLVNNLLDYSRVEAGRAQASYQPVNLAELTADLSSSFRSIIERAGMELVVDCKDIDGLTYLDREMWEKIVLNLLSNAFKYTLEGTITVVLEARDHFVNLQVTDTGVGIPEKELPHMFDRFHRVENAAGRTHEGTGIGLSLVHELVQLHGGEITVSSVEGEGSTFSILIPLGKEHLPAGQVTETRKLYDSSALKGAFIHEAYSLLEPEHIPAAMDGGTAAADFTSEHEFTLTKETTILIVDDNGDMRSYLQRLLDPYFTVATAIHGSDALQKLEQLVPDLILSDMMMPVMDGKGMLQRIRTNPVTSRIPVIFLSARAGEEARIDGLEAGADDYLVKPFSAVELLTKIRAQIKISKTRGHAEQQLREMLTDAPVAIAIYSGPAHIIEMANARMLQYWGVTEADSFDKPLFDVMPELEAQGFGEVMDNVYQTGKQFISGEIPIELTKSGSKELSYLNLTVEARKNEDQKIIGTIVVAADVTEQVLVRQHLEKATDTLKLAMEAANLGTWRSDWGTDNLFVSDIARNIHAIPPDMVISFSEASEMVVPEHRTRLLRAISEAIATKGRFCEDYLIVPMDGGKKKWINSTGKVELNEAGEVTGVIGTIMDITEVKEDSQRKDDFIGMVSHELKTPLTSLVGFTQILKRHADKMGDDFAIEKLGRVSTQVTRMSTMIHGFLNVSRLDAGKIHLVKETFELNAMIGQLVEEAESSSNTHSLSFIAGPEVTISADRNKIESVISNLISNAIKYSPKGKQVGVKSQINNGFVEVVVSDEGMGIRMEDQERLFDRYYRVNSNQTELIGGFGIGLYLCAEIIKVHEGTIWVESTIGEGSKFCFKLPLR